MIEVHISNINFIIVSDYYYYDRIEASPSPENIVIKCRAHTKNGFRQSCAIIKTHCRRGREEKRERGGGVNPLHNNNNRFEFEKKILHNQTICLDLDGSVSERIDRPLFLFVRLEPNDVNDEAKESSFTKEFHRFLAGPRLPAARLLTFW